MRKAENLNKVSLQNLKFYDGRYHSIDKERLNKFEMEAVINRIYGGRNITSTNLIEDLGPIQLDFTNIHPWSEEIPDIHVNSARLFTLWAENIESRDVILILRGTYILLPFKWEESTLKDYYDLTREDLPYYPVAVISSFRTTIKEEIQILKILDRIKSEIELNWRILRKRVIERLNPRSDLWKRYILCFDRIIHFSILCPSIDRELIDALRMKNYRTTGVFQLLASPAAAYDQAMINSHLTEAKKLIGAQEK